VLYDQHLKGHVDASFKKANVLYDQHLKEHVEKARPHYEKHVVPPVEKSKAAVAQAVDVTNKARTAVYAGAVTKFQAICPKLLSLLADLKENKGLAVPDSVLENVKQACSKPEEVVSTFFGHLLLAIIFRGVLWRLFTGCLFCLWDHLVLHRFVSFLKQVPQRKLTRTSDYDVDVVG
jgi:hypothetical protein